MNNQEWQRLNRTIRVAVTRGVFQGVICLVIFGILIVAAWGFLTVALPMFLEWLRTF